MTGSVGLGGSANIGDEFAMFEAIHGSAPRRAGQNSANPSALLLGAVMMLVHIGQPAVASRVHNAWLKTLEDGIHTYDIKDEVHDSKAVGTKEFADAVIERIGKVPSTLKVVEYSSEPAHKIESIEEKKGATERKDLVGVDVFLDWNNGSPDDLGNMLSRMKTDNLALQVISNRGVTVFPNGSPFINCADQWRCRYFSTEKGMVIKHDDIVQLLSKIRESGFDFIKTENLYNFDGVAGYSI
jgi:isocitrate dehydrogenase